MRTCFSNGGAFRGLWLGLATSFFFLAASPAQDLFRGAWDWQLQPRHYGRLSQEERVAYTRAETLLKNRQYEAAALEFEKFLTAFPKNEAYAHALLLQGYSWQLGRFRNKAIERYNEVLDFFGDKPEAAAPAAFLKGMALIENGNDDQGYAVLQEMTDKDAYLASPVADLALDMMADRHLALKDEKNAERCWLRVVDAFQDAFYGRPVSPAHAARKKLTELYIRQARVGSLDALYVKFPLEGKKPADQVNFAFDQGMAVFDSLSAKSRQTLFEWLRGRRSEYRDENREGEWFSRLLAVAAKSGLRSEWTAVARQAIEFFKTRPDAPSAGAAAAWIAARFCEADGVGFKSPVEWKAFGEALAAHHAKLDSAGQLRTTIATLGGFPAVVAEGSDADAVWNAAIARARDLHLKEMNPEKDNGLAGLVDRLRNARRFDRAIEMAQRIEQPPLAAWKAIEVLGARGSFAEQAAACEALEKMEDTTLALRALRLRAQLYKDRLAKYEEALKLYAMINEPPGTIWASVDCYQRLRKPDSAITALSEIETFFERDAPRAGLHKALVWEQAGDKVKTVAALRAVLKKYPKDSVSSTAHQMLERYGVDTGGGVIDED